VNDIFFAPFGLTMISKHAKLPIAGYALRPWQPSDAPSMALHLNNPNIGRNMADWYPAGGYTLAMAQEWCSGGADAYGGTSWAITWHDEAIGSCGFRPQTGFDRCNVEIGYWLSEQHLGKGVGTALVGTLAKQAFELPEITRVYAPIHAHNKVSQRICEKNGFVCEGLRRMSVMKAGQAIDTVVWAKYLDTLAAK
jgi:[ribosomal protein S5]-alanine N-acetyltransferase